MANAYLDLLKTLLAGFVGAFVAHRLMLGREGTERKRRFRAVVELIRFEIEAAPKDKIWEIHNTSIGRLQDQAAHVLLDIQSGRLKAFRENLIKYSKLTSESLPAFMEGTVNPRYEAAVASIIDLLANLIELTDEQRRDFWLASKANRAAGLPPRK